MSNFSGIIESRYALFFVFCTFLLGACASPQNSNETANNPLSVRLVIPHFVPVEPLDKDNPGGLFSLSESNKKEFLNYFNAPHNADIEPHKRLANYLERRLSHFAYRGETLPAEASMNIEQGNCMSLAILTTALARLADLDVSYQRVNTAPLYYKHNKVLTLTSHVRTLVRNRHHTDDDAHYKRSFNYTIVDYFPSRDTVIGKRISEYEFISMYFQNLAGDALLKDKLNDAERLASMALSVYPENRDALNIFAVALRRQGKNEQALAVYDFAFENDLANIILLENYSTLLVQSGNHAQAAAILAELGDVDDDNPYRWLEAADRARAKGYYMQARRYYERALEMAPYLHEAHFGMAAIQYELRQIRSAAKHMQKAVELSAYTPDEALYNAKWHVLQEELD